MTPSQKCSPLKNNISCLFEPESVAVIGSLRESWFGGYVVTNNLLKFGFKGKIYPINPGCKTVLGLQAYPNLAAIDGSVDLAVIVTSSRAFPGIIEECVQKRVKAAVIVSDGFAERNKDGAKLQQRIIEIARPSGLRLIGPNTLGIANSSNGLVTNPYVMESKKLYPGSIALYTQSGIFGAQSLPLEEARFDISKVCDVGNKCDVDESDILEYFGNDPNTRVIVMHLESIRDGRRFIQTAQKVTAKKPVLVLKPGRTMQAAQSMVSHTGSLAGEDLICDAAMRQAGIIRVNDQTELLEFARMFAGGLPLPTGNRLGMITYTGGAAVMAIDTAVESGLTLATFSSQTRQKLRSLMPELDNNPVDIGMALPLLDDLEAQYSETLETVAGDPNVDCLALIIALGGPEVEKIPRVLISLRKKTSKPIAVWYYGPKMAGLIDIARQLGVAGLPVYSKLENAIGALGAMYKYSTLRAELRKE